MLPHKCYSEMQIQHVVNGILFIIFSTDSNIFCFKHRFLYTRLLHVSAFAVSRNFSLCNSRRNQFYSLFWILRAITLDNLFHGEIGQRFTGQLPLSFNVLDGAETEYDWRITCGSVCNRQLLCTFQKLYIMKT